MTDVEKEESQKTVVSFITGLLIGGLLVWVFSSTPEEQKTPVTEDANKTSEQSDSKDGDTEKKEGESTVKADEIKAAPVQKLEVGKGVLTVTDQGAGMNVELGSLTFPVTAGWVVVRDDINGVPGNVLGAARFSTTEGLSPKNVELIRQTESGKSYQVMYYSQEGGIGFALGEDMPIDGMTVTFKAQ